MVKYNNWNTTQDSIFYELNELSPEGIIDEIGVENLNFMFSVQYGDREIPSFFEDISTKQVAKYIHQIFMSRWEKLNDIAIEVSTLPTGYVEKTVIDENYIDSVTKNITANNSNNVSVFNHDSLIENSSDDEILEQIDNKNSDKQYTQTKSSIHAIDIQRKMLENESISEAICRDVASKIVLMIY